MHNLPTVPGAGPPTVTGPGYMLPPDRYALPADLVAHRLKLQSVHNEVSKFQHALERQFFGVAGLDALIGLVPWVGDAVSGLTTGWLLIKANQVKVSFGDQVTMIGLGILDFAIGFVTGFGDIADLFFRAHAWNSARILSHIDTQLGQIEYAEVGLVKSVPVDHHKENLSLLRDSLFRHGKTKTHVWIRTGVIVFVCLALLGYCAHSISLWTDRVRACEARRPPIINLTCQLFPGE